MKNLKKLMSIALTAAMTSALTFPAMAATITISDAVKGQTYSAYKIFDYKKSGSGSAAGYTYTMDQTTFGTWGEYIDDWKYDSDGDGVGDLDVFSYTAVEEGTSSTYYFVADEQFAGDNSSIAKAFGTYLKALNNKGTPVDTAIANGNDLTQNISLNVADNGYYFVDTTVGTLVNLFNADNDITITEKTSLPTVSEKKIVDSTGENPADISSNSVGEMVYFEVTVTVAAGNDDEIRIHDSMGNGLALNANSIKLNNVAVPEYSEGATYYLESSIEDGCDFEVVLTEEYVKILNASGANLTLTYNATVTDGITDDGETGKNEAWTTYKKTDIPGDETKVYAADFAINKVIEETDTLLAGAKFRLYGADGNEEIFLVRDSVDETVWIVDASEDAVQGEPIVTNANNNITIKGLKAGTYWLEEVEAPAGYNLLTDRIQLKIEDFDDDELTRNDGRLSVWETDENGENGQFVMTSDDVVKVENSAGATLPSTGGIGTTIFYAAGIILMAGAVFFVVRRKRA